jgi:hypothetical protein
VGGFPSVREFDRSESVLVRLQLKITDGLTPAAVHSGQRWSAFFGLP